MEEPGKDREVMVSFHLGDTDTQTSDTQESTVEFKTNNDSKSTVSVSCCVTGTVLSVWPIVTHLIVAITL